MSNDKRTIIEVDAGFDLDPSRPLISFTRRVANTQCASAHHHPRAQLIYCNKGMMRVEVPSGVWVVGSLQGIWIPGGVVHQVYFPDKANLNSIFIAPAVASALPKECFAFHMDDFCKSLILKISSFNNSFPLTIQQERIERVLLDELALAKPGTTFLPLSTHVTIRKIMDVLEKDQQYNYSINHYANLCCVSSRTLSRLFIKELGMSFTEWTIKYKLIEALKLLGDGNSVKEIAFKLGYESPSSFIYAFKKSFNVTPGSLQASN